MDENKDDLLPQKVPDQELSTEGAYKGRRLQQEPPVEQGKEVKAGDIIGKVGSTAAAEGDVGPHLHFSVSKDGKVVNPSEYVK